MTSAVTVRRGRPEDLHFIEELGRKLFAAYGSYDRYLREWFDSPEVLTVVAEVDGAPAGVAMLAALGSGKSAGGQAELLAIGVEPALQGRGVGASLLSEVLAAAPTVAGFSPAEVHLSVAEGNARAERFFARHGFRRSSGAGVYPAGQKARLMVKKVESGA